MNREPPSTADEHDAAAGDLPWFANGSLAPQRQAQVAAHLAKCALCRRDLAALETMAQRLQYHDVVERSPGPGLARVNARIDEYQARRERGRAWLQVCVPTLRHWRAFVLPAAVAVQSIVILALVVRPGMGPTSAPDAPAHYRTLTDTADVPSGGTELRLVFDDRASVEDVRGLLEQIGGEVIAGPSAAGVMTVRVPARGDGGSAALERARAHSGVVFAEVVASPRTAASDREASE